MTLKDKCKAAGITPGILKANNPVPDRTLYDWSHNCPERIDMVIHSVLWLKQQGQLKTIITNVKALKK